METLASTHNENSMFLDEIIAIRDDLWANEDLVTDVLPGELSEQFAMLDSDLAALHKDMKTAANQLLQASKTGQMTEVIKWRLESAQSAYQTRLIEVRFNKLSDKEITKESYEKRIEHEQTMQDTMNEQFAAIREKRLEEKKRKESNKGSWFFYFMLGLWLAQINSQRYKQNSQIASPHRAFTLAKA